LVNQSGQPVWETKKIITIYNSKKIKEYETLTQNKKKDGCTPILSQSIYFVSREVKLNM